MNPRNLKTPLLLSTFCAVLALYWPSNAAPPISVGAPKKISTSALGPHDGGGGSFVGLKEATKKTLESYFQNSEGKTYLEQRQNQVLDSEMKSYRVRTEILNLAKNLYKRIMFLQGIGIKYDFNLERFQETYSAIRDVENFHLYLLEILTSKMSPLNT